MFCLSGPQKPGADLPYQPPLVPLPLATHPTWREASTPLRRSKLSKVDEALSLCLSASVALIHVFIPDLLPLVSQFGPKLFFKSSVNISFTAIVEV